MIKPVVWLKLHYTLRYTNKYITDVFWNNTNAQTRRTTLGKTTEDFITCLAHKMQQSTVTVVKNNYNITNMIWTGRQDTEKPVFKQLQIANCNRLALVDNNCVSHVHSLDQGAACQMPQFSRSESSAMHLQINKISFYGNICICF